MMTDPEPTLVPVVLSGGVGARLWPASRRSTPKQLLPLVDDRSMIRATVDRVAALASATAPIVVTNTLHATAIEREMASAGFASATVIIEPVGRNTAPAVAVAAHEAMRGGADPVLFVLPSDHTVADEAAFAIAANRAREAASSGNLVTFGIRPDRPETGYGYVQIGTQITEGVHRVTTFREKPDVDTAAEYLESGNYLWNSGMFVFKASVFLEELDNHAPELAALSRRAWADAVIQGHRVLLDSDAFTAITGDSIDYAVMEHTHAAAVVPTDPGWNDVGSWASLWEIAEKDNDGNAIRGDVLTTGVTGSLIRGGRRLVAVVGVEDVVVVDTDDVLLVAGMDRSQDVKTIVDKLERQERPEYASAQTTSHPWGTQRIEASGPGFVVRHVSLDPGAETPIYTATETSTRWHVLAGIARLTVDGGPVNLAEGGAAVAEAGVQHQLSNVGAVPVEAIAITVGLPDDEGERMRYLARVAGVERQV